MGSIFDITAFLRTNTSQFTSGMKNAGKQAKGFSKEMNALKGQLLTVFSVGAVVSFTKESMKLAAATEGVSNAFKALNKQNLLSDLRKATRGAVSDMSLMKAAVMAENFKIPLDQLATFLQFAGDRALSTGQDFDYLVDSIIRGLGRNSVLVLDNLGLSAKELQDEAKKTGSFFEGAAKVIQREMKSAGDVADTTTTSFGQFTVAVENLKTAWGNFMNDNKIVKSVIKDWTDQLTMWADKDLGFWEKLFMIPDNYIKKLEQAKQLQSDFLGDESAGGPLTPKPKLSGIETLATLKEKLKFEQDGLENINILDIAKIENQKKIIKALQDQIDKISKITEESNKLEFPLDQWMKRQERTKGESEDLYGLEDTIEAIELLSNSIEMPKLKMDLIDERDEVEKLTRGLLSQSDAVGLLSDSFQGFFYDAKTGWQSMLDTFSQAINRFLAEQAAKALLKFVLNMVAPGSGTAVSLAGAASNIAPGMVSSQALDLGGQNINIGGEFKISGKDLGLAVRRNM